MHVIHNIPKLIENMKPGLINKAEEDLANNRPIKFDKIEFSVTGLSNGLEKLPWHKIEKILWKSGIS